MKFADVTNDVAFRKIFGNQNKKEVLISFLNAVLDFKGDRQVSDVTILNPFQLSKFRDGKATIIDVKARDQKGREFLVEMQLANALGFSKRVLYYVSQGYVSQIERGDFYDRLNPTVFIGVLDFEISKSPKYLSRHQILDVETGERILEDMEFNFIELPKFTKKRDEPKTFVEKWVFFIKEAENLDVIPEEMDDPGLRTAFEEANIQTWDKEEIEAYNYAGMRETEDRLRFEKKLQDALEKANIEKEEEMKKAVEDTLAKANMEKEEAMKKAVEDTLAKANMEKEGEMKNEKRKMAGQMKKDGVSSDTISKYTGLSVSEIENL